MASPIDIKKRNTWPGSFSPNTLYLVKNGSDLELGVSDSNGTAVYKPAGGSVAISNDTSTNATYYPTFATATSGNMETAKVSNTKLTFNPSTGTLSATNFNSLSDKRYKKYVKPLTYAADRLAQLRGYSFVYKESNQASIGLIAQEVEAVMPELVHTDSLTERKTLNYNGVIALLVEVVNKQQSEIQALKAAISKL